MSPADGVGGPVRLLTWNIHGGVGTDRRCDLDRVLSIIEAARPDVAALQEVDGRTHLGRRPRAFERIAERLGGHVAEARLTGVGDRAYGHLLWSRWPLESIVVHRLPGGRIEPRAVVDALVRTPGGGLRVLAAHFGLVPGDRRRQAAFVARLCGAAPASTVALGDFNDWRLDRGAVHRLVGEALPVFATSRTWPSWRPLVAMDRIYASPDLSILTARAETDAATASDHLPFLAEIGPRASRGRA